MMKRKDLEDRFLSFQNDAKTRFEANPVGAFFIGLVVGIALTWFRNLLVPALLLSAIAVLVLWVIGENDESFAEGEDAVPSEAKPKPKAKSKTNGGTPKKSAGERTGAAS